MEKLLLETECLILRDYTENDIAAYCRLKTDAQTMFYLHDIQFHSIDEAKTDCVEFMISNCLI